MKRLAGALALLLATARAAYADAGHTVEVAITGGGDEAAPLAATVRELLARVGLTTDPSTTEAVLARARIDLSDASVAHLVVVDKNGKEILKRDVLRDASASIAREAIAHEVQTAVESQLIVDEKPPAPAPAAPIAVAKPALPPEPAPDVVRKEEPPKTEPDPFALDIATFAGGGPIADDSGLVPRIGGSVTVATTTGRRKAIAVTASYALPFEETSSLVTARTSFVSVRAMPSIELYHSRWSLEAAVGGGVDVLSVDPRSSDLPGSALRSSSTHVDAIATGLVTQRVELTPGFIVFLSTGIDVDLATRGYVVERGPVHDEVLVPWRVRPVAMLGLSFTAIGAAR